MRTPTQRLADYLLERPIEHWVADRRTLGLSWRRISLDLRDLTQGQIDVAPMTLISWMTAYEQVPT